MIHNLKLKMLLVFICGHALACQTTTLKPADSSVFDGRWVATLKSATKFSPDESVLRFQCEHLTYKASKVLNFIVKDGQGIVIGSGPTSEKGSVKSTGSFEFKNTRTIVNYTSDNEFIQVAMETILSGSLNEESAKYSINYVGFDAGCDFDLTLQKVADRFKS